MYRRGGSFQAGFGWALGRMLAQLLFGAVLLAGWLGLVLLLLRHLGDAQALLQSVLGRVR